ncbi:probable alpha-ketoglutarate-dependent hypophosphite dioxygenase [Folsomia candida]|uniref:phytanoyl-CoA dioxygenase n=1 Tax=Folsomia candida TaxID=158441 RepID=A0A226E412_FOLCA|nr:probable alpha-ketoglutarate-dependent hypophosphite dioxygenase [Folsomia candida]XP_021956902.1 probable alpha-ketoglutarate-dependent hypophosphite dioxygenase [Folsomia candida]OXA51236.1 putative alpha-ketoglutarate-dependent hypophosphite dioxygenase [Folsomia candida]
MSLLPEQKQFYSQNGYILVSNIFTETEISECSTAYDTLFADKVKNKSNLEAEWKGNWKNEHKKQSVLSIHNLQCHSSTFTKMLLNQNLLDIVAETVGSPNVCLHHTKAHIKPEKIGATFPTHQDYHYFPYKNDSMVAIFIHLDDSDTENGGLAVFPGSHRLGPQENKSNVETHFYVDQDKFSLDKATSVVAKRGDVLIFSYLLVHGSYPNVSDRVRRMLLFQMMAAEDVPLKGIHLSPCHGMVLRGRNAERNADIEKRHEA